MPSTQILLQHLCKCPCCFHCLWSSEVHFLCLFTWLAISVLCHQREQKELKELDSCKVSLSTYRARRHYIQDNCSTALQTSPFSLINMRLEELTQKHRPISGWLVLGEMKFQWVLWKYSNMENGAPRRKWCKITIVSVLTKTLTILGYLRTIFDCIIIWHVKIIRLWQSSSLCCSGFFPFILPNNFMMNAWMPR